jgi:hypothetical protein
MNAPIKNDILGNAGRRDLTPLEQEAAAFFAEILEAEVAELALPGTGEPTLSPVLQELGDLLSEIMDAEEAEVALPSNVKPTLSPEQFAAVDLLGDLFDEPEIQAVPRDAPVPVPAKEVATPSPEKVATLIAQVADLILDRVKKREQPSAAELLEEAEAKFGWEVRWVFLQVVQGLRATPIEPRYITEYFRTILTDEAVHEALAGGVDLKSVFKSSFDDLFQNAKAYRDSGAFQELISFTARFTEYAPYNNLLVKVQNPSCQFFATQKDWRVRFGRELKDDPRPMLILAPMHPVMLVYDMDQTEGGEVPRLLQDFNRTEGKFEPQWMENLLRNVERDRILVEFRSLSSTHGGYATTRLKSANHKMRIAIHDGLDAASAFSVLCHELAHIYLGHLGADSDGWWPCRINLSHSTVEIEAEATAYITLVQLGLRPASEAYLSTQIKGDSIPESVSVDLIAKRAGKLVEMATKRLPERKKPVAKKS